MKVIGITGGVGSGKSEVLRYVEKTWNARILLADEAGHLVMKKGQRCYCQVLELFGAGVLAADGELDRKEIARIVYGDQNLLHRLNQIIHPAVRLYIMEELKKAKKEQQAYFFLEAALLLEERYDEICDEVWYIYTDAKIRRERLMKNRQYTREKVDAIMANQLSEAEFAGRCDVVIHNSGAFEETKREIENRMSLL